MNKNGKKLLLMGFALVGASSIWTWLIQTVDVQSVGLNGTDIGFATFNTWFHGLTGVNMTLYTITDWLGLVPICVGMIFGFVGLVQWIKSRKLFKVDFDIRALGIYYIVVIFCYLIFEMIPINYRPIFINGFMEASYPSSTTLLVLGVMPTLVFQANIRLKSIAVKKIITIFTVGFSVFMVVGRLISGVHWITDIVGSILLSAGLFYIYKGIVLWNSAKSFRI
ncbi:MAG: phosphatase PAP2 family protein [Clostridia bacterium]|nr:phosphatase PAP2 family protein [Clostridia bacterium]